MAFAKKFGFEYRHSDLTKLMPINSIELRKIWSNLITVVDQRDGRTSLEVKIQPSKKVRSLRHLTVISVINIFARKEVLVDVAHLHVFTNWFPESIEELRNNDSLFYANPFDVKDFPKSKSQTLAVHVRRGQPWEASMFGENRLTENKEILRKIAALNSAYGPLKGVVYSASHDEELESLLPKGFVFNSDANEFEVIHSMISADFAVLAKSSMSYVAGIFARGKVVYDPFWHPPLSNWITL
jgi:hypothetical protein